MKNGTFVNSQQYTQQCTQIKNGSLAMMCIDAKQSFQSCFSLSRLIYFIAGCRKCFIPKRLYSLHVLMLRGTYF